MEKKAIIIIVFAIFLIATIPGDKFLSVTYVLKSGAALVLLVLALILLIGRKRKNKRS